MYSKISGSTTPYRKKTRNIVPIFIDEAIFGVLGSKKTHPGPTNLIALLIFST